VAEFTRTLERLSLRKADRLGGDKKVSTFEDVD